MTFWVTALSIMTAIGVAITTLQALLTFLLRRHGRFFAAGLRRQAATTSSPLAGSFVSILKPVCGLDDELEENLETFARLRGMNYEVIVSIADSNDAAMETVRRVRTAHPHVAWRVVIGGSSRLEDGNRKVARLIAAARAACGDILFISDSNVRVEPDDIAKTVAAFADPKLGCVSNLFTGARAASFGATIESLHLLSFVAAGNVLAAFGNVPCVVGKSMAISRRALEAIGGFEAFANVLAEDQAIGLAVREAGYRVTLSPIVVRNVVVNRTLRRALDRQIRWNKIRFAFSKAMYSAEFLVNPLPLAIVLAPFTTVLLPIGVAVVRIAQVGLLSQATGARLRLHDLLLVPLLDVLQFGVQFVPYIDDRVTWRGYSVRLGPNTVLLLEQAA
jgi:ceramide glucosyltransferase